ncbi:MAG: Linoleoyl-CoA desaturase [uncultured Solirubrobacteraceae bacterium]|uniref:Linoleoyl-CoA desaturase n=1 Tax=uncultured Solirubrobacteraceae bacterium TaxID=1162706 RepID=A0A6J4SXJ9_9ACTN|nr:MAG: Linoleoyl-CoA desaturase [uncultured Solirubrobacteraceae bacterium]
MSTSSSTAHLDQDAREALAAELDALHAEVRADLGARDAAYIRGVIKAQRQLEAAGRALLLGSRWKPALAGGTVALTLSKVIENMELGHNIMHGQWDWMRDPAVHSTTWEWDAASTARSWKHSHNFQHHTYTNVVGKDRDLGYSAMRVDADQPWRPVYLAQPVYGMLMALTFEWGIALYDMELDAVKRGEKSKAQARQELRAFAEKALTQLGKDYALFPALAGRKGFARALAANVVANLARNLWVHTVVFMGHIPEPAETFTEDQYENETRGDWYVRQVTGSCNLDGSPLFHLMTGNLSFQIEHHLFPDVPSSRYSDVAPRVREICGRYGLPYHSGRLGRQYRSVAKKILRLSFPGGGPRAVAPAAFTPARAPEVPALALV